MSQMYSKGKGKGKTNGKDGKKQGHTLPRTRITAEKFSGVVAAWKGKYGWIKPGEEIDHEKANLRSGNLFASHSDVLDGSGELHPGAPCEFHIWEDDSGLGCEEIVETGPPDPDAIPEDPKGKPKGGGKPAGGKASPSSGGWGGDKGYGKAPSQAASPKGWSEPYGGKGGKDGGKGFGGKDSFGGGYGGGKGSFGGGFGKGGAMGKDPWGGGKDPFGKGKDPKGKGKDGKGKGKSKYGGKGHLLPRTRVTAEKFQGTVSAWKGKFGWITPAEEIEHEKAKAHKGGLFVSKDDLEGITELTVGATVEFHIWEDETGLGAEEVIQY